MNRLIERKDRQRFDHFACGFEVKFAKDQEDGTFAGYGAVFGNVDEWGDVILKGAFKDTLKAAKKSGNWPAMLMQHGYGESGLTPIGIWTDMSEDDTGLYVEGKLALKTRAGAEAYELLKMTPRPALRGMSIGYCAIDFAYGTKPEQPRRTLKKVDLFEVSLVTFPANDLANVDAVKAASKIKTKRQLETFLRDVGGFSITQAKSIASGFSEPNLRDEDAGDDGDIVALLRRAASTIHPT